MNKEEFFRLFSSYQGISSMVRQYSYEEITEQVAGMFSTTVEELEKFPGGEYSKNRTSGAYKYVLLDLIRNITQYDWVYERLADGISRQVFTNLIRYRVLPDLSFLQQAFDGEHHQYFDSDIIHCSNQEVFVDCGGFIGDTAEDYIAQYKNYKTIYVYEPSPDNITRCRENLRKYPKVKVRNCGVGEKNEKISIGGSLASSSFLGAESSGELTEMVALDQDIKEKITFIKMDVEGFEIPAILGAKGHIRNDSPKLAICTYHIVSDIWEIPRLIDSIHPGYKFYFRHYRPDQNGETVFYAVPVSPEQNFSIETRQTKRVVALAPYERGWSNVELIKDCGLIPYLLYKNHGCDVTMVGARGDEYTYLDSYVKGIKMEFLEDGSEAAKLQYMMEKATEIDCLILRGCHTSNFTVAKMYKMLHPTGCIYVGLDANGHWMDRILWENTNFMEFMDCCDVIATSCQAMQDHLNLKWPWKIYCIPNGFYSFKAHSLPDFKRKENIVLTVGRLGTQQKATEVLLEAFAQIAENIPDWRLRLVGTIEESFQDFLQEYFQHFPELKERVDFTGPIQEREILQEEYQKAKIFALPSEWEGGTPNVIAEALNAGCVTAVTQFDAYEQATDHGKCGRSCAVNDTAGFAQILLYLCKSNQLEGMADHAYRYGSTYLNMEYIVAKLSEMLFGGMCNG